MGKTIKLKRLSALLFAASLVVSFFIVTKGVKEVYAANNTILVKDSYESIETMLEDISVSTYGFQYTVQRNGDNTAELQVPEHLQGFDYSNFSVAWIQTDKNGGDINLRFLINSIPVAEVSTYVAELDTNGVRNNRTNMMPNSYDLPAFAREDRDFVQDHTGFATDDGTWIESDNIVGTIPGDNKIENDPNANKWHDSNNDQTSVEVVPPTQPEVSIPVTSSPTQAPSNNGQQDAPQPSAPSGPTLIEGEF